MVADVVGNVEELSPKTREAAIKLLELSDVVSGQVIDVEAAKDKLKQYRDDQNVVAGNIHKLSKGSPVNATEATLLKAKVPTQDIKTITHLQGTYGELRDKAAPRVHLRGATTCARED